MGSTSQCPHHMQMLLTGFYRLRLQRDWDTCECRTQRGGVWGTAKDPPAACVTSPNVSHKGFADFKDRGAAPQGIPSQAEPWMRRVTMWSPCCKAESRCWGLRAPSHRVLFRWDAFLATSLWISLYLTGEKQNPVWIPGRQPPSTCRAPHHPLCPTHRVPGYLSLSKSSLSTTALQPETPTLSLPFPSSFPFPGKVMGKHFPLLPPLQGGRCCSRTPFCPHPSHPELFPSAWGQMSLPLSPLQCMAAE